MKKKLLAIFLAVAMLVALTACGQNPDSSQNPDDSQNPGDSGSPGVEGPGVQGSDEINGYFSFSYSAGDVGQAYRYLHFYTDPGYGAVVYAGAQTGTYSQMGQISFYTVEKKDYSYAVWASREDVTKDADTGEVDTTNATKGTAPYTITFTSVTDGSVVATCGYDGENLYTGGPDQVSFFPSAGRSDTHNLIIPQDAAGDRMPSAYGGEGGTELFTFYNVENSLYQVIVYHTGEYVNALADRSSRGTVTYADGVFTLSGGGTITVTDTAITYVNGDTTVALSKTPVDVSEKTVVIALDGTAHSSYGFDAAVKLVCYDDGTCEVLATIQGADSVLDSGTYTNSAMGIPEKAMLDTAGEVAISVDFATMVLSADLPAYTESGFDAFTVSASLSAGGSAEPEVEVLLSLEGTSHSSYGFDAPIQLVLYTNGTCEVIVTVQGSDNVLDSGTYTNSDLGVPNSAALETAGEVAISVDFTTMTLTAELPAYAESGFEACTVSGPLPM